MGRVTSVLLCGLVLVTLAVALAPPALAVTVTYTVSSESMARGTSTGFANEAYDDAATDTKTEGGTSATVTPILIPTGDATPNAWGANVCTLPATEYTCVDDNPPHDGNTTYVSADPGVGASVISFYDMVNINILPGTLVSIDTVTVYAWARVNTTVVGGLNPFYLTLYDTGTNCASVASLMTLAYANYSAAFALACSGGAWTETKVNSLQVELMCRDDGLPPAEPNCAATATGVVVSYTLATDFYLDFTSTFLGVVGAHQALVYECTTTDETTTLTATVGSTADTVTCNGGLNRMDLSTVSGSVDVRIAGASSGDLTQSTYAFDVLTLVSIVEEGGGGAPRADFTYEYVWWGGRVLLHDASTGTVGNVTYSWRDVTNGVGIGVGANASYFPYGWLDFGVHEIVVEHTVVDEYFGRSTVQKVVRIDNTPRFLVLASLVAIFVVILAMVLMRDKKGGKRRATKPRVVRFDPGKYLNRGK